MDPYLEEEMAKAGIRLWDVSIGEKLMETVPGIAGIVAMKMSEDFFKPGASRVLIRNPRTGETLRMYVLSEKPQILFGLREDFNTAGKTEICDRVDNDQ